MPRASPLPPASCSLCCCLLVKPDPPIALSVRNTSNNQLELSWRSPFKKSKCLQHCVQYKSNKDSTWMVRKGCSSSLVCRKSQVQWPASPVKGSRVAGDGKVRSLRS